MDMVELENKSFDFWFSLNEKFRTKPTTKKQKELLRLGYHFGFQNALKISKELSERMVNRWAAKVQE